MGEITLIQIGDVKKFLSNHNISLTLLCMGGGGGGGIYPLSVFFIFQNIYAIKLKFSEI